MRRRNWCVTINNWIPEDKVRLEALPHRYLVIGEEVGEEKKTPHLQAYAELERAMRLSTVSRLLAGRAHLEPRRGTPDQAADYCKKEGKFTEFGTLSTTRMIEGASKSHEMFTEVITLARQHKDEEIIEKFPSLYVRYYSFIDRMKRSHPLPVTERKELDNWWYVGPSGSGKSSRARRDYPEHYPKLCNKWWDGYQNQDVVILDDLDPTREMLGHSLKIWADWYPFIAEIKGSSLFIRPKTFIVTSQYTIDEVFSKDAELAAALKRRFKVLRFVAPLRMPSNLAQEPEIATPPFDSVESPSPTHFRFY